MKKRCWPALMLSLFACAAGAQTAATPAAPSPMYSGPGSYGGTVSGTDLMDVDLMFIGAHPDDDGGVGGILARYLLDGGYKGTVVTLTGGEGGGNATGRETGRALGLIREEEERRSLAMLGVNSPHFLGLRDFYFTLSAEETLAKWGGPAFVCDVVRLVRLRRPEVIVTMWPGPGTHGQHQMAARAATLAYATAGDPATCPEQLKEGLQPFTPLKLYYYPNSAADTTVSIPTDDVSRTARIRYADLKNIAQYNYRTQGWDTFSTLPAKTAGPETFMLVASRVATPAQETSLLTGALTPSGSSPAGVRLEVQPATYDIGAGQAAPVTVKLTNTTGKAMTSVMLALSAPVGWTVSAAPAAKDLQPGETASATFQVTAPSAAAAERSTLTGSYSAAQDGQAITGRAGNFVRPLPAVVATFAPTFDVAAYQDFARQTGTDWVIGSLPTRLALALGQKSPVGVTVTNRSNAAVSGKLDLKLPAGITLSGDTSYQLAAGQSKTLALQMEATSAALPAGRQSALLPVSLDTGSFADTANAYVLPTLTIPRLSKAPVIDGDLSDMQAGADGQIGPDDLWWKAKPDNAADASGKFKLGYDDTYLYVGMNVKDDVVSCNIAPDDIKAQLRSDAIGVTVDPSGSSKDTSTTMQAAAFPCTTAGFGARGFRDADANQGVMEETAPGMQVASKKVDGGYDIEFRLPWAAMPKVPKPGDTIGLNLVMYDGDQADARVGANISQSGLAWAAFSWGGKQALPYLWPRVTLGQ
ncbi:hypothetical protein EHF33_18660 (plasmid) [Deinococcus psychrotolerans]|uniref:Alpha-galactosidase NEW3 domain-containing protein n=1 Tax=Deinococcus psychrotolerans TaxID=2489213 RepID=A0A3G8YI33_9DEIO|nr:sugar-binding protein [Deinococcus psychrotolerans]AZI44928.1 hypothetical protein EHF33_18660 [Deinococcus psychrotolerans]